VSQPKQPPKAKRVEPDKLPSEGVTVDPDQIAKLRERLNKSDVLVKEVARALAKQASEAKRSISLSGKPSLRRYLLVELMLDALDLGEGDPGIVEALLREHSEITTTLGAALGGLDIEQITKMSTTLKQIKNGEVAIQYNNDTYTVGKGQ
jgi:hypothetical protein